MAATICYEAIFPGEFLPDGPRPDLILNVTNDAWFGQTPGPYQHFAQARFAPSRKACRWSAPPIREFRLSSIPMVVLWTRLAARR